jgi:hypothetical protein
MLNNIKAIKLLGGDIIMGQVKENLLGHVTITEPQQCVINVDDGKMEVLLADWIPFAMKYEFKLHRKDIVTMFDVKPQLLTNYKIGTGNNKR